MGNHVAQTGKVDLVRLHNVPHGAFHGENHGHQMLALIRREIGHFLDVRIQNHAAKTGVAGVIDPDHAAEGVGPEDISSSVGLAEWAVCCRHGLAFVRNKALAPMALTSGHYN